MVVSINSAFPSHHQKTIDFGVGNPLGGQPNEEYVSPFGRMLSALISVRALHVLGLSEIMQNFLNT